MPGRLGAIFPPRFTVFFLVAVVGTLALGFSGLRWGQAVLAGFDAAAIGFVGSLFELRRHYTNAEMQRTAQFNDTSRVVMLLLTAMMLVVIVTAVIVDLPAARKATGEAHVLSLVLVLASLVIAWGFANFVLALHYAHLYYRGDCDGGLNFPEAREGQIRTADGADHPLFDDFVYFALTIGMAFATSDVEVTRRDIRNMVTLHGAAAFFYNLVVLAFTINVTASG